MENKIEVVIWYGVMIHVIFVHTLDTKQKNPVAILGYILYFTFPHIWSLPLNTFKCYVLLKWLNIIWFPAVSSNTFDFPH